MYSGNASPGLLQTGGQQDAGRNADIEVLRGLAIVFTLIEHFDFLVYWSWAPYVALKQQLAFWGGVDVFFAVSGFVIMRSLLRAREQAGASDWSFAIAGRFWLRRLWRLWPAAWLWVVVCVACSQWFNRSGVFGSSGSMLWDAFAALGQFANLHWSQCYRTGLQGCNVMPAVQAVAGEQPVWVGWVLAPYWSLSLEEQFYWLLPLLLLLLRRGPGLWLTLCALVVLQLPWSRPALGTAWYFRTDALLLGVLLGLWSTTRNKPDAAVANGSRPRWATLLVLACLGGIAWLGATSRQTWLGATGGIAVLCALLVALASLDRGWVWPAGHSRRWLEALGERAYSLYLVHLLAFGLAREVFFRLQGGQAPESSLAAIGLVGLGVLLLWGLGELSLRWVEQPARRFGYAWVERRLRRGSGRSSGRPAACRSGGMSAPEARRKRRQYEVCGQCRWIT